MKTFIQLFTVALLTSVLTVFIYSRWFQPNAPIAEPNVRPVATKQMDVRPEWTRPANLATPTIGTPTDFVEASKVATPAVVFINTLQTIDYNFWIGERIGQSSGSGVIVSSDGYIMTNNHVVDEAKEVQVTLNDNREYKAEIVGTDPTTDLALLKIEATDLPFLPFGNSDALDIGEWVLAVGNPLRLESTVTAGIVSAKGRNINILDNQYSIESFIQTDAVVNPGNSGGALVSTNAELIGINTAIITRSGNYEGYSFAIPSNLVRKVMDDLKEFGNVQRGLLGIRINDVTADIAERLDLPTVSGVYINSVFPGGAADEGGLRSEDVILAVNKVSTISVPNLQEVIGQLRPGEEVDVEYFRSGEFRSTKITLKNQLNSTELLTIRREGILKELGMAVREFSEDESRRLKTAGVKVVSIKKGSIIDQTNMVPDYIITHINGEEINTADQLVSRLEDLDGKILLEGFYEKYKGEFPYSFNKE